MARRTAAEAAVTRRELVHAALEIFGECGYAAASLGQIAARAGVTRGALYHHFNGKADVYDTVLRQEADQVMGPLMADLSGDGPPLQRLREFFVRYTMALERDMRFRRTVDLLLFGGPGAPAQAQARTSHGYRVWLAAFEAVLSEARDRGELREGVALHVAATSVVALAVGMTTTALRAPELFSPAERAGSLADLLLAGLAQ